MLRDKLLTRLREMGAAPDHQRLVAEVLGIRGAPPDLARRLVAQALVMEDRREVWQRVGERICRDAPSSPGVYVLRDEADHTLYVGKAINLRRRLHAHFADRRWRAVKPELSRAVAAEWQAVGSELEALLREAALIEELRPSVNIQTARPALATRSVPAALVRDILVVVPSIEEDSVELVGARVDGGWTIQRTRRDGTDLPTHTSRLMRFFRTTTSSSRDAALAPIVFSWLAGRGATATRLDPRDVRSATHLRTLLAALLKDELLFAERLEQRTTRVIYSGFRPTPKGP